MELQLLLVQRLNLALVVLHVAFQIENFLANFDVLHLQLGVVLQLLVQPAVEIFHSLDDVVEIVELVLRLFEQSLQLFNLEFLLLAFHLHDFVDLHHLHLLLYNWRDFVVSDVFEIVHPLQAEFHPLRIQKLVHLL